MRPVKILISLRECSESSLGAYARRGSNYCLMSTLYRLLQYRIMGPPGVPVPFLPSVFFFSFFCFVLFCFVSDIL